MRDVMILRAFSYRVATTDASLYKAKALAKHDWFKYSGAPKQSLVRLFVDDFVNNLVKLNGATLTYEFNGRIILSASMKYITSMQVEVKTPSFSVVLPEDVDEMKEKLLDVMERDEETQRKADINAFIESLR